MIGWLCHYRPWGLQLVAWPKGDEQCDARSKWRDKEEEEKMAKREGGERRKTLRAEFGRRLPRGWATGCGTSLPCVRLPALSQNHEHSRGCHRGNYDFQPNTNMARLKRPDTTQHTGIILSKCCFEAAPQAAEYSWCNSEPKIKNTQEKRRGEKRRKRGNILAGCNVAKASSPPGILIHQSNHSH